MRDDLATSKISLCLKNLPYSFIFATPYSQEKLNYASRVYWINPKKPTSELSSTTSTLGDDIIDAA
ncbi:MAG: hypothetical protein RMZ69_32490 [Nostoc sp. ChiQUE01a]|nr:hypothetical protein [Nostoc sp. ChiQUE01a]